MGLSVARLRGASRRAGCGCVQRRAKTAGIGADGCARPCRRRWGLAATSAGRCRRAGRRPPLRSPPAPPTPRRRHASTSPARSRSPKRLVAAGNVRHLSVEATKCLTAAGPTAHATTRRARFRSTGGKSRCRACHRTAGTSACIVRLTKVVQPEWPLLRRWREALAGRRRDFAAERSHPRAGHARRRARFSRNLDRAAPGPDVPILGR